MVSNGSKQIMFGATMASVNPGDEVIVPVARLDQLCRPDQAVRRRAGLGVVPGEQPVQACAPPTSTRRSRDKTKWVVLNFPNNPTGAVCTREEMKELADVLLKHPHVLIMADEIYEHLIYDGVKSARSPRSSRS